MWNKVREVKNYIIGENPDRLPVRIKRNRGALDLHLCWVLHNKCNYSCSYCPPSLHDGSVDRLDIESLKGFVQKIEEEYIQRRGKKEVHISFAGGEPTIWPEFQDLCEYISSKGISLGMTTNASISPKFFERVGKDFYWMCFSFHPEKADIDRFLKNYKLVHDNPDICLPTVRVMMHPDEKLWAKSIQLSEEIMKFPNYSLEFVHILDDFGATARPHIYKHEYQNEFMKKATFQSQYNEYKVVKEIPPIFNYTVVYDDGYEEKLHTNDLINKGMVNFKGWECSIGLEQLFINHVGEIFRAGCKVGGEVGHLSKIDSINFPSNPIICNKSFCHCGTDIQISKEQV